MGLSRAQAQSSLRLGLGWGSRPAEIERFVADLGAVVKRIRSIDQKGANVELR